MIQFDKANRQFHLSTENFSYVFKITQFNYLRNLHTGARINDDDLSYLEMDIDRGFFTALAANGNTDRRFSLDSLLNEFPIWNFGDFRQSALLAQSKNGSRSHDLRYSKHEILKEKPPIPGMPSLRGGETLVVTLSSQELEAKLYYTVYADCDCITRRTEITNLASEAVSLSRVMSLSLDLPAGNTKSMGILHGKHAAECSFELLPLRHGLNAVANARGSGSHQANPFLCLCSDHCGEFSGEVFGFNLVYGGNFLCQTEVDQLDNRRVQLGINPYDFCYDVKPGQTFYTPECVMTYSADGLCRMSQNFHDAYRRYLIPERFVRRTRPIVVNNWEATYFDFDSEKLFEIIDNAAGTGIDTFVLDDGWFGRRNNDFGGLGDWYVNTEKLKGGLQPVIDRCKAKGLKFGLWFEPEMICTDSELFSKHPDWCIQTPGISPTFARSQLVLNLSYAPVREYVIESVASLLRQFDISYVKWDFNRNITDSYSPSLCYDYMLGFYHVAKTLTEQFPNVLFEGCSGGGGRFDPSMLAYFPQIWTSDCTDACERTKIQYGTSLCYPLSCLSSHVSACPNHQTERMTPLSTRIDIASLTAFGYELNPVVFTEEERARIKLANEAYREDEQLILEGDLYRLCSPFESNFFCFLIAAKDRSRAVLTFFSRLAQPNQPQLRLKARGLCDDKTYCVRELNLTLSGRTLQTVGISLLQPLGDFVTLRYHIDAV